MTDFTTSGSVELSISNLDEVRDDVESVTSGSVEVRTDGGDLGGGGTSGIVSRIEDQIALDNERNETLVEIRDLLDGGAAGGAGQGGGGSGGIVSSVLSAIGQGARALFQRLGLAGGAGGIFGGGSLLGGGGLGSLVDDVRAAVSGGARLLVRAPGRALAPVTGALPGLGASGLVPNLPAIASNSPLLPDALQAGGGTTVAALSGSIAEQVSLDGAGDRIVSALVDDVQGRISGQLNLGRITEQIRRAANQGLNEALPSVNVPDVGDSGESEGSSSTTAGTSVRSRDLQAPSLGLSLPGSPDLGVGRSSRTVVGSARALGADPAAPQKSATEREREAIAQAGGGVAGGVSVDVTVEAGDDIGRAMERAKREAVREVRRQLDRGSGVPGGIQ